MSSYNGHDWKMDNNGEFIIDWLSCLSAPESIIEIAVTKVYLLTEHFVQICARLTCSSIVRQHDVMDKMNE